MAARPWPDIVTKLQSTRGAYAYLVRGAAVGPAEGDEEPQGPAAVDEAVLIDTGFPGRAPAILAELERLGLRRLAHIVITHGDVDHVGNAAELQERTGAELWLPRGDRPFVMDHKARPGIKRLVGAIIRVKVPAAARDLEGRERVGPLVAIPSPGHTPGHMAFAGPGFLAVGDALTLSGGRVVPSRGLFAWDAAKAADSATRLLAGYHGWVLPAHQEPAWFDAEGPRR
jgi:glyoxylase-like metal-dependent hydrolase (beta-lactamase superfamily II)